MSANVWFEEVNTGLLKELKKTVRIKNADRLSIPLEDKALVVRKPEEDFKFETFPCISIYNLNYEHSRERYNPSPILIKKDVSKGVVTFEDPAVPFDLEYQIDFWARYQEDMDSMLKTWLMKHFHQFNLKVVDDGGTERTCNCLITGKVRKSDLVLGGERLFHSIVKYHIWVELDDETRYNTPIVIKRDIKASELK